jgi:hypothetical protein
LPVSVLHATTLVNLIRSRFLQLILLRPFMPLLPAISADHSPALSLRRGLARGQGTAVDPILIGSNDAFALLIIDKTTETTG